MAIDVLHVLDEVSCSALDLTPWRRLGEEEGGEVLHVCSWGMYVGRGGGGRGAPCLQLGYVCGEKRRGGEGEGREMGRGRLRETYRHKEEMW